MEEHHHHVKVVDITKYTASNREAPDIQQE